MKSRKTAPKETSDTPTALQFKRNFPASFVTVLERHKEILIKNDISSKRQD